MTSTRDYIASRVNWHGRRPIWRLYKCSRGLKLTPLSDYTGHGGKSGLRKIRDSFRGFVTVHHLTPTRDQFTFRVKS